MFKDCKSLIEFSDYNYDTNLFLNEENTLSNKIDKKKNDIFDNFYGDLNQDFSLENNNNNSFYFSTVKLFTDNEEEEDENKSRTSAPARPFCRSRRNAADQWHLRKPGCNPP